MKKLNLLSRAEMKKVVGGMATTCVTNADCAPGADCVSHSCCRALYSDACSLDGTGNLKISVVLD